MTAPTPTVEAESREAWVLVPCEPKPEQFGAGGVAAFKNDMAQTPVREAVGNVYRAMIAAAPAPPIPIGGGEPTLAGAREAFLSMIADAGDRFQENVDGDTDGEGGAIITVDYSLSTGHSQLQELWEALGFKIDRGESLMDAITREVESPITLPSPASGGATVTIPPMTPDQAEYVRKACTRTPVDMSVVIGGPGATGGVETGEFGYVFYNPDTGFEWAESHPITSGEVPDATDVRAATQLEEIFAIAWYEGLADLALAHAKADALASPPPIAGSARATLALERIEELAEAHRKFVAAREAMNAARPAVDATQAERAVYGERYDADRLAERHVRSLALKFAADADAILALFNRAG